MKAHSHGMLPAHRASEKVLSFSEWVLMLTSLPPALLNTEAVTELYRVRWQIEV